MQGQLVPLHRSVGPATQDQLVHIYKMSWSIHKTSFFFKKKKKRLWSKKKKLLLWLNETSRYYIYGWKFEEPIKSTHYLTVMFFFLAVTECNLDPLQFAYQSGRGVDDTKLFILNTLYRHLEGPQTPARILFTDFSSPFNTIQPHILANELVSYFSLDNHLVLWIIDFFTNRLQSFCQWLSFRAVTDMYWVSSGVCPLSTSLHSIYRWLHLNRFLVKFADNSALLSLLQGSEQYRGPNLTEFVDWCNNSYLDLN